MMKPNLIPFNLELLTPSRKNLAALKPITNLGIMVSSTKNFHPEGLFSTEIFGKVGSPDRSSKFSYIDLHITIFHPLIFKALKDLRALYHDIMLGKKYAIYNTEINDFIETTIDIGETGFDFFYSHFKTIKFEHRESNKRIANIELINKYREDGLLNYVLVMPAGYRDYEVDETGKPSEDEINSLYRRILSISNSLIDVDVKSNLEFLDATRYNLQVAVYDLYAYIKNILEGKGGLIQSKWASRQIFNSTRNILTSHIQEGESLDDPKSVSTTETIVGLYQYARMVFPLTVKNIKDKYLSDVFIGPNSPANLIDVKTFEKKQIEVKHTTYDNWMSYEGIEKIAVTMGIDDLRHLPVEIEGYYLALIYNDGTVVKVFHDINDLPEGFDKEHVSPITLGELFYLSLFETVKDAYGYVTRYPVTGYGSIFPTGLYLKSTVKTNSLILLDDQWKRTDVVAKEFPIRNNEYYNSTSVPTKHLGRLGADFDGDSYFSTTVL